MCTHWCLVCNWQFKWNFCVNEFWTCFMVMRIWKCIRVTFYLYTRACIWYVWKGLRSSVCRIKNEFDIFLLCTYVHGIERLIIVFSVCISNWNCSIGSFFWYLNILALQIWITWSSFPIVKINYGIFFHFFFRSVYHMKFLNWITRI